MSGRCRPNNIPPPPPPKNWIIEEGNTTPPQPPNKGVYTPLFNQLYDIHDTCLSGVIFLNEPAHLKTSYKKCEYCGTVNNVSYEINNCESCGAQFGLLEWLENVVIAERVERGVICGAYTGLDVISEYKSTAIRIISNAFKNHIKYMNDSSQIYDMLHELPDQKIENLMDYFGGFFKPDKLDNSYCG